MYLVLEIENKYMSRSWCHYVKYIRKKKDLKITLIQSLRLEIPLFVDVLRHLRLWNTTSKTARTMKH